MTTPEPFTETQKSRLFFILWRQTLDVMHAALKSRLPFNEGIHFIETTEPEDRPETNQTSAKDAPPQPLPPNQL